MLMTLLRVFIAALALPLLWSCSNIPSDFKFEPDKPTGVVVGSISYESSLARIHLIAQPNSGAKPVRFSFGCDAFPCVTPWNDSDFSVGDQVKQRAGGYAVEVPEGTYRLVAWEIVRGRFRTLSSSPINIEFTVEKGKVSYLGNLHFDPEWEDVQLRDRAMRDLPALRAKYPTLANTPLAYKISEGAVIKKVGGAYQTRLQGPIYIPIFR